MPNIESRDIPSDGQWTLAEHILVTQTETAFPNSTVAAKNTDATGVTWTNNAQYVGAQALYNFVFQQTTGYTPHDAVDCATTTVLPAGTYDNGSSGVGATFTVTAHGTLTIDGHLTILGDRVLVKNQVAGLQDGIYTVSTAGTASVSAVLTRATDADTSAELLNSIYAVLNGTVNAPLGVSTFWYVNNTTAITIGTDAIGFTQIATPSQGGGPPGNQFTAPLNKQGNTVTLAIDSAPTKATPVDADEQVQADSAASFVAKKVSNTAYKAYLKAYFDTIYATVSLESLDADIATVPSTGLIPAGTYTAQTYLATSTGAVTIDGRSLLAGDRVLDKDNATAANRGLWTVTVAGAGGIALAMTRSQGMQQANEFYGALVIVLNGTANSGTFWKETAVVALVGTDAVTFSQFLPQIPANSITNAMLAQAGANTLKGNATSGTANETDLTAPVVSGEMTASDFNPTGLTGATTASRYVGGVAGAAPTSGTFAVGDFVSDTTLGGIWTCIAAGTPGTFVYAGPAIIVNHQTGTSYTVTLADWGKTLNCDNGSAFTLTVPANGSTPLPQGYCFSVLQGGVGQVSVVVTTDTRTAPNGFKTSKQGSIISCAKIVSTTETTISGDTA